MTLATSATNTIKKGRNSILFTRIYTLYDNILFLLI